MSTNYLISAGDLRPSVSEPQKSESPSLARRLTNDKRDSILVGESLAVRRLRSQIQRIAPYFRTALIRGESGSGKELVARALHILSPASDGPFIVADAVELAKSMGGGAAVHSGPAAAADPLFESAQGGTLYIKHADALPGSLQDALLHFLCDCEGRRATPRNTGLDRPKVHRDEIRIVVASDRDLRTLSAISQFSRDLYARLSAVEIIVPPLRQCMEDIPILAERMLRRIGAAGGRSAKLLAPDTLTQMQRRLWPGNLRELEGVIAQASALAEGPIIEPRHLLALADPGATPRARMERLHDVVQQHVCDVLTRCGGNKLRAAELLGISRSTLYRMLEAGRPETTR